MKTIKEQFANLSGEEKKQLEIKFNNEHIRYNHRQEFFHMTFDYLVESGISGDYYEFGCHKALTFRMALAEAYRRNLDFIRFYAFDSFEGLPELQGLDALPGHPVSWRKGALMTSEQDFLAAVRGEGVYLDKISIIKGFYDTTLTEKLQNSLKSSSTIALAFVDCDLYESASLVLKFIEPLLQKGAVIYLDDFYHFKGDPQLGEQRAFSEMCLRSSLKFIPHLQVSWFGKSFIVN